jgi:uncharacterized protein YbaR (Trm112 family)
VREAWLRKILRCPACGGELQDAQGPDGSAELVCVGCALAYRIEDDIPVLLVDEARKPEPTPQPRATDD